MYNLQGHGHTCIHEIPLKSRGTRNVSITMNYISYGVHCPLCHRGRNEFKVGGGAIHDKEKKIRCADLNIQMLKFHT